MCMRSESESASHSSPPQLKRVRVISACVCERVRAGTIPLISLYCVCLSAGAHRDTKTHTHKQATLKTQANTCQVMIENQHILYTFTQAQYLSTQQRGTHTLTEAMTARQKYPVAGPKTGCRTNQATCSEEKQRIRPPAVRYTQKKQTRKGQIYT
jgi:hypothetical protein